MFRLFLRKLFSFIGFLISGASNLIRLLYVVLSNSNISAQLSTFIAPGTIITSTDGGKITFGKNVYIGDGCEIKCNGGDVSIGDYVHIGKGCVIVCLGSINIDIGTQIAEYVVIRDQDHRTDTRPIRLSDFSVSSIKIGKDCWLGAKSTVLRGSTIGDGAVIGAHSLVRGDVPPFTLAAGCPAQIKKRLPTA